ncbi:hypothetical protein Mal15_65950 [Stieleria maiorica]|uniref:Uncharacterized protein n=1 Tax=Stieleria maiorica TaxID=2795974 RepID=A0A5B9MNF8_9BACT|nr:hypothetical protein [Stieleria maiorica]QEG02474.1 hypothetical protein Mal15_65950 [Stieleria maiorica]
MKVERGPRRILHLACILGIFGSAMPPVHAPLLGADNPPQSKLEKAGPQPTLATEREQAVLQMVHDHLPEIKVLLDQLREKEPKQYGIAISNLAKSSRRLQTAKKRGEEAFELEVHVVQAQSAINLLVAKLKIRDNKKDRAALREATKRLELAQIARASFEVEQIRSRLDKLNEQLETAEKRLDEKQSNLDDNIQKGFQTYLRKSGRKE